MGGTGTEAEAFRPAPCFECLERRILEDFSPRLIFCYGVSDLPLPFGSTAVVQVNLGSHRSDHQSMSKDVPAAQFVLKQVSLGDLELPKSNDETDLCKDNSSNVKEVQEEIVQRLPINDTDALSRHVTSLEKDPHPQLNFQSHTLRALAPLANVVPGCYKAVEDIASRFIEGLIEDNVMSSLDLFLEGKLHERFAADFLILAGLPTFEETKSSVYVRHPNIVPLLGALTTQSHINLLYPKAPYTLENILHYSPDALQSDWHKRFLLYQVVSALAYLHGLGIAHGSVCPSDILLTHSCWSWLNVSNKQLSKTKFRNEESTESSSRICCCVETCACQSIYSNMKLSASMDWPSDFKKWWAGEMSNYEYLLVLNRLAGRRWGDHTFYPVMPWVIDFSVRPDEKSDIGWRDLQKSKWRLAKGDEQLDFTYSTSDVPHHVSDECLSELAVCSYKARRLPLGILRAAVRSVYEPNEYPANMQRLYQWTPDECIPEFYSDPRIFSSLHPGMSDLALPPWATSPEDFISLHRKALESDRVSQQIHHWIDITFGYKLSGQPSIAAKNVMLQASDPTIPKCTGRRQLFTGPHPMRHIFTTCSKEVEGRFPMQENNNQTVKVLPSRSYLHDMEEVATFCENSRILYPLYNYPGNLQWDTPSMEKPSDKVPKIKAENFYCDPGASTIDSTCFLEYFDADGSYSTEFQDLLRWKHNSSFAATSSEDLAKDIFSVGCILAELYIKKPLFDKVTLDTYLETGIKPEILAALPPNVALLVEECIQQNWRRRPSAKHLLEAQYFSSAVRSAYVLLAPLQLLSKPGFYLQYAAKLANKGVFKAMGPFALEMCVPYFIPAIIGNLTDVESEASFFLLKEIVKSLNPEATKTLVLPSIQKILQALECSNLKIFLLQESFVREIWKRLGKQEYLEKMHPFVISNVCNSPNKISASAASVLLICSSEELGLPITLHQTVVPLIYSLGKGISPDGIDVLVRIGSLLGENFIVRQLLPLLRHVVLSWINVSSISKSEPSQSWNSLALLDALSALHGLSMILPSDLVLKELVVDQTCLYVKILSQHHLDLAVIQVAATTLIAVCQRIGPESTALHVLPQLKDLFDELAYSQDMSARSHSSQKKGPTFRPVEASIESQTDLVLLLYPSFASLIGIEKLRQCCSRWLLLEQHLQRCHNWKWECTGEIPRSVFESTNVQRHALSKISSSEYNPAKLLLNGVGWSMPLSQGPKSSWNVRNFKQGDVQQAADNKDATKSTFGNLEPWFWFPGPAPSWCSPEFLSRVGSLKDDLPWKIKSCVLHSIRAHPAALRSLAVNHDECAVFTGGVGPGFKGTVQKWEMSRMNCVSGYYGHDEVVNDICILSVSGRIASCDGTVHVWNSQTGKLLAAHAEPSINLPHHANASAISSRAETDQASMLIPSVLSGGILSTAFSGSLYTCMHYLEASDMLVVGMGNGSIRFIDVAQDRKLHLWKSSTTDCSFSSLVSAICCFGSKKNQVESEAGCSSWIAAGLSSGHCRLLDIRSGDIIAQWKAHDGYITKLASPDDRLLVSCSLDKTLRVWDLRKNLQSQSNIIKGHSDGISSFAIWGKDVISVSRNKIGLSSLSRSFEERGQQLLPQKLYTADRGTRNLSVLTSISILPFSRLFMVGTEDGYLKICC